jgi:hypothetical protein
VEILERGVSKPPQLEPREALRRIRQQIISEEDERGDELSDDARRELADQRRELLQQLGSGEIPEPSSLANLQDIPELSLEKSIKYPIIGQSEAEIDLLRRQRELEMAPPLSERVLLPESGLRFGSASTSEGTAAGVRVRRKETRPEEHPAKPDEE